MPRYAGPFGVTPRGNMRQAITLQFRPPTNHRDIRIIASAKAGRITVDWCYNIDEEANFRLAAERLITKYEWYGRWALGSLGDGRGVAVMVEYIPDFIGNGVKWIDQRPAK